MTTTWEERLSAGIFFDRCALPDVRIAVIGDEDADWMIRLAALNEVKTQREVDYLVERIINNETVDPRVRDRAIEFIKRLAKKQDTQGPQAGEWHIGEPPFIDNLLLLVYEGPNVYLTVKWRDKYNLWEGLNSIIGSNRDAWKTWKHWMIINEKGEDDGKGN